jgi:cytochrome c oxidase subunit 1
VDTGWTFTTPLSTHYVNTNVMSTGMAVFIAGFSSVFTGLNFIVTIHKMRCPGMTWFRLPLFVLGELCGQHPDGAGHAGARHRHGAGHALERTFGIGVFDPTKGGDPLLFQHLFWFYSHPAVYIMILPGMGVISEVVSTFSRKRVFGYTAVAFSSVAIAVFGFFVWAHHMFIMGISNYAVLVFSLLTMLVAVPSAIKIFNWAFTLYKGSITFETPMLYAFGFMGLFTIGGMTGVFLGTTGTDIHLTETYFIVAHFHFVMVGGMLMAFLSGMHFWWPKMDRPHVSGEDLADGRRGHLHRLQPSRSSRNSSWACWACRGATRPTRRSSRYSTSSPPRAPAFWAWATCCRCSTSPGRSSTERLPATIPGRPRASSGKHSRRH